VTRSWTVRVVSLTTLVVLAALVALLVTRPVEQGAVQADSALLNTVAPPFEGTSLAGHTVRLDSLRGRVVVLSFFASWCAPCAEEAPDLASFAWHVHVTHERTTILGVIWNDLDSSAASFAHTYGLTYPVLKDPGGAIAQDFSVSGPPETVVINPVGRIAAILLGPVTDAQLEHVTAQAA
jgi:cytochrome c biogenesis protein CcmG, thiol:disulfide interchange protein DsbE